MEEAFRRTRKSGATGIDSLTGEDFARDMSGNIDALVNSCKSGEYRAPAVRRAYIPKGRNDLRPLGIPTFSDKVLQRAVVMLLEPIYEQTFYDCSFGFRSKRSALDCIKALRSTLDEYQGGYVLDIDIRTYFDSIPKAVLRELIATRVRDGVITRMIGKWLNAGVMEKGQLSFHDLGTPQGGVISPLLANIYLHYVLDDWFYQTVLSNISGPAKLFRFADDFVVVMKSEADANRLLEALKKRFTKYGLRLHEGKSRLVDFRKPKDGCRKETFNFLGFTFYWGKGRKGTPLVKLKTAEDRFTRTCSKLTELCRRIRHEPIKEQRKRLNLLLTGHYRYFGVSFNTDRLWAVRRQATKLWFKWLKRRSQRRHLTWPDFVRIIEAFPLAEPRVTTRLW